MMTMGLSAHMIGPFQKTAKHEAGSRLDRTSLLDQGPRYKHM